MIHPYRPAAWLNSLRSPLHVRFGAVLLLFLSLILPGILSNPSPADAAATLELYGSFNAMGIIATIGAADDVDQNATATVQYRTGAEAFHDGFSLSRVDSTHFVGSLFWLNPGTAYTVNVTFSDTAGSPLNGVVTTASLTTRAEINIPAPAHSYHVSQTGSGSACTLTAPCSLSTGINAAQAGDAVILRGGTYYEGQFDLVRSGAAGAPIVIRSYPGEAAVLDGSDPASFTWTADGGGVYHTTVNIASPHVVLAGGARLFPYQSLSALQNRSAAGMPGFYATGTSLYVRLANDANPSSTTFVISRFPYAFNVDGQSYIYFLDLTFRYFGQGEWSKTIYLINASDNLVQGNTFISNDVGVALKYDSHRNVIQDNSFNDVLFDWDWESVKERSGGTMEDGGIYVYDTMSGRGTVIRRNTFHDDFDAMHVCPENSAVSPSNEIDVYDNQIYRMADDGMETDGYCSNLRIWGNTFHDVLMGISLAPVHIGPVYAIRNLIYRTGAHNHYGSSFKFNVGGVDPSGPMYLFHNTTNASLPDQNGLTIFEPQTWSVIYSRNNIWSGTQYAWENYNTSQPVDFDYDDLWTSRSGALAAWNNTDYPTLPELTAATGQESHGLNVQPSFATGACSGYGLAPGNPLVDAGILIPGINDRGPSAYQGAAPDIGAFEYSATTDPTSCAYLPMVRK